VTLDHMWLWRGMFLLFPTCFSTHSVLFLKVAAFKPKPTQNMINDFLYSSYFTYPNSNTIYGIWVWSFAYLFQFVLTFKIWYLCECLYVTKRKFNCIQIANQINNLLLVTYAKLLTILVYFIRLIFSVLIVIKWFYVIIWW
jgi:hypothetical protein